MYIRYKSTNLKTILILSSITLLTILSLSLYSCGGGGGSGNGNGSNTGSSNSATLTWDAPTTNADGTPLTDLAGYKIYYGTSSGVYSVIIDVGNVTTFKVDGLSSGTYYFAVTAYDNSRNEGGYSNEVSKEIK